VILARSVHGRYLDSTAAENVESVAQEFTNDLAELISLGREDLLKRVSIVDAQDVGSDDEPVSTSTPSSPSA
jgi:hypothetical protein